MRSFFMVRLALLSLLWLAPSLASATTCTQPGDWIPAICDGADWGSYQPGGSRCWGNTGTYAQMLSGCSTANDGCAAAGCFGPNPPGHWVATVINGVKVRCRCGCWAEETTFATTGGSVSAKDIVAGGESQDGAVTLTSLDVLDGLAAADVGINNVVYGLEKAPILVITTESGRSVTVTSAHPMVIATESGALSEMKAAEHVAQGDLLLDDQGKVDRIVSVERRAYEGRVVNFNVKSDKPGQHVVAANGLLSGDNAWQQALAARDARRMVRADILKELADQP